MVSVTSEFEQDDCSNLGAFQFTSDLDDDDLCLSQTTKEVDVSLEWLSAFVEECLSTKGSSLPLPTPSTRVNNPPSVPSSNSPLTNFSTVLGKARSKRRRRVAPKMSIHHLIGRRLRHSLQSTTSTSSSDSDSDSDPLLLQQTYWLAESELLLPHKAAGEEEEERKKAVVDMDMDERDTTIKTLKMEGGGSGRRCSHCQAQRTPQWRGGPLGPKTLCNACGVRYKSGRLHPEYRPANSPTFVSFLHSNSHKRVMEMRMMNTSSSSSTSTTYHYST
ncbi:GATA transcription factor 12-like [Momordica charantia]|uniref:GATA transcription factor 12-like n=1 Tax=Momordica charantia TaxID=3673 RepID=A0A6J1DT43_MOMCH|nr:GATA transcription factor 12-like [Momordica charantia]